jgi:hypothetical protein
MKKTVMLLALLWPCFAFCAEPPAKKLMAAEEEPYHPQGVLQVGLRSTVSAFSHDGDAGFGSGGQFRLRFTKKVNSEWFIDYLSTNLGGLGKRADAHIGWSIIFYPFEGTLRSKFTPYLIAGHCFDYTRVTPFNTITELHSDESQKRWSSATQAGLGVHWNLSERFNISFSSQYMIHLGNNIHTHVVENNGVKSLEVFPERGASMEGHLLTTLSLNIRLFDLW